MSKTQLRVQAYSWAREEIAGKSQNFHYTTDEVASRADEIFSYLIKDYE